MYIYQYKNWPDFTWNNHDVYPLLVKALNLQGKLMGKMEHLGFDLRNEAMLQNMTVEIVKSSEIEGELIDSDQVRSSVARHLGIDLPGLLPADRNVEGIVDLMMDATQNYAASLSAKRLFNWHASLFPTGRNSIQKILVGKWRKDTTGPMQIVSGPMGKERVHFQAPASKDIAKEMKVFILWFNKQDDLNPVLKAAIAHLWFVTIHPFDDGNGRITRALTEMLLSRSDSSRQRFYSMSAQIRKQRKSYYDILEKTQRSNLDITEWILWFLNCFVNAINASDEILSRVLEKSKFWKTHAQTLFNLRQQKMINKLLDGFDGKLNTTKWAKISKCSQDTALRDIQDLIGKNVLRKESSGGRSTSYEMVYTRS